MENSPEPRLSHEGPGALLLEVARGRFDDAVQARIWQVARDIAGLPGVGETVPGMNNLMVVFDPLRLDGADLEASLRRLWRMAKTTADPGELHQVEVRYGGEDGVDLEAFAAAKAMGVAEIVARHTAPVYSVAAVGAMPGFPYLSGLDPQLAAPRLSSPRAAVPQGSVIIGGAQAGIMPVTAPSGWHILGRTDLILFDPHRPRPALLAPGDQLRFVEARR